MLQRIRNFTDSTNFTRAVIVTFAAALPAIVLSHLGFFNVGFAVALGAFLTYPADIPSNLLHRTRGLLIASLIVSGCVLIVNVLHPYPWIFYPVTFALVFFLIHDICLWAAGNNGFLFRITCNYFSYRAHTYRLGNTRICCLHLCRRIVIHSYFCNL